MNAWIFLSIFWLEATATNRSQTKNICMYYACISVDYLDKWIEFCSNLGKALFETIHRK